MVDRRKGAGRRPTDKEEPNMAREALELSNENKLWQAQHQEECLETRIEIRKAQAATDKKVELIIESLGRQDEALDGIRTAQQEVVAKSEGLLRYEAWIKSRHDADAADAARKLKMAEWWASTRSHSMQRAVLTFVTMTCIASVFAVLGFIFGWDKALRILTVLKGG